MRPVVSGLLGAVIAYLIVRWLGRRFPVRPKPHSLAWYQRRYSWIEWVALASFLVGMGVGMWLQRHLHMAKSDPRGAAVGFVLGCLLPLGVQIVICVISPIHRFGEYWDFQELKHGARSEFGLYIILPVFAVAAYGVVHLLLTGP